MTFLTQIEALIAAVGADMKVVTSAVSGAADATLPDRVQLAALGDVLVVESDASLVVSETSIEILQIPDSIDLLEIATQGMPGPLGSQGAIQLFAGAIAPPDWMMCQGQALDASSHPFLAAMLGFVYGGNGATTFALPDLRGAAPHPSLSFIICTGPT